jgi:hypothetical protein
LDRTFSALVVHSFAAQQAGDALIERLDPRRAAVVMALGLTLVGLFLITFVMVGGHWVRRLAPHRPGQRRFVKMARKAMREALQKFPAGGELERHGVAGYFVEGYEGRNVSL